ncbi:10184_t:CDS:2 [Acaulospora morrowiae]|uniref:10184_t:CDS:1 n=1 Tax=Acaulospora morrowiae TaxID=94023 RepID=A0A9N8Z9P1_9GLOM|nr:10184_t:CDS:2 [Acaulospora morrowiae]
MLAPDAILYYALHFLSILPSFCLLIAYRRYPTISCYSVTLLLDSIISGVIGLIISTLDNGMRICHIQAVLITYVICSLAIWPACIEFTTWIGWNYDVYEREPVDDERQMRGLMHAREGARRQMTKKLLYGCMGAGWLFPTFIALLMVLLVRDVTFEPWSYHCTISKRNLPFAFTQFFTSKIIRVLGVFFICLLAMTATIIFSVLNAMLIRRHRNASRGITDISLHKRIPIFGIAVSILLFISLVMELICTLAESSVKSMGTWPDFLMALLPYMTFLILGTNLNFRMNSSASLSGSIHISLEGSSIIDVHERSITPSGIQENSLSPQQIQENLSSSPMSKIMQEKNQVQTTLSYLSSTGPSTFSQRMDPNSPNPFMHRKNPLLTIKIPNDDAIYNKKGKHYKISKRKNSSLKTPFVTEFGNSVGNNSSKNGKRKETESNASGVKDISAIVGEEPTTYGRSTAFHRVSTMRSSQTTTQSPKRHVAECEDTAGASLSSQSGDAEEVHDPSDKMLKEDYYHKEFSFEKRSNNDLVMFPSDLGFYPNDNNKDLNSLRKTEPSSDKDVIQNLSISLYGDTAGELFSATIPQGSVKEHSDVGGLNRGLLLQHSISSSASVKGSPSSSPTQQVPRRQQKQKVKSISPSVSFVDTPGQSSSNNLRLEKIPEERLDLEFFLVDVNLPMTPSFGMTSKTQITKSEKSSSGSSNSHNSMGTISANSRYSNNNGFTLTPRGNIPLHLLNRNSTGSLSTNSGSKDSRGSSKGSTIDFGFYEEEKMREFRRLIKSWDPDISRI